MDDEVIQYNSSDVTAVVTTSPLDTDHEITLAGWNFHYVAEPLIISAFIFVAAMLKMSKYASCITVI